MFSKQLLTSLSLFVIFGAFTINAEKDTSCIDAPAVKNFDRDDYYGIFYTYALEDDKRSNFNCIKHVIYGAEDDDTLPIVTLWVDKSDNEKHMLLENAKLDSSGHGVTVDGDMFTIVGTDYYNYAVIFACDATTKKRIIWVLTREAKPGFTDLFGALDVFDEYQMNISDLNYVDHNNCPGDWSDAKVDEVSFTYAEVEEGLQELNITKQA